MLDKINPVRDSIVFLRKQNVILDVDLARLYEVETKHFNQAVKRNIEKFPEDFMFKLTQEEKDELVTNCDLLIGYDLLKHFKVTFNEGYLRLVRKVPEILKPKLNVP